MNLQVRLTIARGLSTGHLMPFWQGWSDRQEVIIELLKAKCLPALH